MKGGYMGKVLKVDLDTLRIHDEGLPSDHLLRQYIGCWGLGLRYLYRMLTPGYTVLDAENPLVFMTGPLTGLHLPGATNTTIATKNFDTKFTVGRSHSHGTFGILMKAAGYDGLIITGKSEKPVYLWIHNDKAELRDASHLWGKSDTHETDEAIKQELGNSRISVAAIGPCGENLCAGAMICNDRNHSFSHSGVGSVMGAKKLKAIAVFGKQPVPVADPEKMTALNREWLRAIKYPEHVGWGILRNQQSKKAEYRHMFDDLGAAGKNLRVTQLLEFGLGFAQQRFIPKPCPRCPVGCSYDIELTTGPHKGYVGTVGGGAEALEGAGSMLGITEPSTIYYLTDQYDRLGIEANVGCTMAMAMEAYEKGLITSKDTDGLELNWGNGEVAERLLRKIVYRDGFGDILARGVKEAAEYIGGDAPNFAVHIKGGGMNLHNWKTVWGLLFGQIVGSGAGWPAPGADHHVEPNMGYAEFTERFDRHSKPMEARKTGIIKFLNDSTGLCWFITWGLRNGLKLTAESLSAATGIDYTPEELLEVGERLMHLERAFNVRHGLKPEDDWNVPKRLVEAPTDGRAAGISIEPYLKDMVLEYYRLMGWDERTGKPWRNVLTKFDLGEVANDLWG